MKNYYLKTLVLGLMGLTMYISPSQNILYDGDFSVTTEIVPFDGPSPPINQWAFWVNYYGNGSEANPTIVDGVCNFQITNAGNDTWDVQLGQWGFPLTQGHTYQLSFDVKADANRTFGVYLGEDGGNYTNLIGYDRYLYDATTEWQIVSIEFEATAVFAQHKFSFEMGTNTTTMYFDNVVLQDLNPTDPNKIVIAGSFQDELGCYGDWNPDCDATELTLNSETGFYTGVFQIPEGSHRYKVTQGGSWDINYGENGLMGGADIYLCVPSGSEAITFTYDPTTHLVTTSPIASGFSPECPLFVVLVGSFQDELGCYGDWVTDCPNTALSYNASSGLFEGDFYIPTGCYDYRVVLDNNWINNYGQEGIHDGPNYTLSIPENPEMTHFTYDPFSHVVSSTPYGGSSQDVTKVSLVGNLQDELGCPYDYNPECDNPMLQFNTNTAAWEGSFILPAGCYSYIVKETFGCNNVIFYGENGIEWGNEIQLYLPENAEIAFSYNPQSHIISSTPYSGAPQEVTKISLLGTFQDELGCGYDYNPDCDQPALMFNSSSGAWEGSFTLPAGCYDYQVKEIFGCNTVTFYGENGMAWGNAILLFIPSESEIMFSYDPQTHIISSSPYSGVPQELAKVSLQGTLQDELGCPYDNNYECDDPMLQLNTNSGAWEGSFTLPAGCYTYMVKETFGCNNVTFYGENGIAWGSEIQLYIPTDSEIMFSYDPQTHIISSTPYSGAPQEVTKVSLLGSLQDELGCAYDYDYECNNSALQFNSNSGLWEGSFTLPTGCYYYQVKETFGCNNVTFYGENGIEWGSEIQLYVPSDGEITFSYDPQTHIMSSMPYSGVPQEVTKVSLYGTLQDELGCVYDGQYECDHPALQFNANSGLWEGSFILPAGCYTYQVKETFACNVFIYGENGIEWGNGMQLYVPSDGEISFSYNAETHIMSSTPYSGAPTAMVSLIGTLQDELGCEYDYQYNCTNSELVFNSDSGTWEGSFTLPAGCYYYWAKEISVCNTETQYGDNGIAWGDAYQLYVPSDGEMTFSYDPQTHIMSSTPYSGVPQEVTTVSLYGTLQDELGCAYDFDYECDSVSLTLNLNSGTWEGSFNLPPGCYTYLIKEAFGCFDVTLYGDNGNAWGELIQLYVLSYSEITFSYDPQTHIVSTTPYTDISTLNQCPDTITVNNTPGSCGAIVDYPEFVATANCGGDILSITQTAGLPSGSMFPVGMTTNTFLLTKTTGEEKTCSFDVVVVDTESPVISDINEVYDPLWPPNHKMVPVFIDYNVADNCGVADIEIYISSNEPINGLGDGDTSPDWEILDGHNVLLRAERSGKGNGRQYTITIKAMDASGNYTEQSVIIKVSSKVSSDNLRLSDGFSNSELNTSEFTLYPNPASDIIHIKGPKTSSSYSYIIYDLLGAVKKTGILDNDQIEIKTLSQGLYILKLETDQGTFYKKFIRN